MSRQRLALFGATATAAIMAMQAAPASAAEAAAAAPNSVTSVGELVVTAQKREESINTVGMSVQAATGASLQKLGITNT